MIKNCHENGKHGESDKFNKKEAWFLLVGNFIMTHNQSYKSFPSWSSNTQQNLTFSHLNGEELVSLVEFDKIKNDRQQSLLRPSAVLSCSFQNLTKTKYVAWKWRQLSFFGTLMVDAKFKIKNESLAPRRSCLSPSLLQKLDKIDNYISSRCQSFYNAKIYE